MIQPDKIIRSARKTLSVSVDALGQVTVRAPKTCTTARIIAFLSDKESWILRKKSERAGAGMHLPPENLDGFSMLVLGEYYTLRLINDKHIRVDAEQKQLFLPSDKPKERLIKWLKENAKRIFAKLVDEKSRQTGLAYKSVGVGSARTRWGSCTADNRLTFSFRLLYAPKGAIEYVVVHELAHVKHKNHSKAFWLEVEKYIPDYKIWRKWLKDKAYLMKIF